MLDTFIDVNGRIGMTPTTMRRQTKKLEAVEQCCPSILTAPLDATEAKQLALGFTALADPVRLQLLSILATAPDGEVCICDFVEPVGKSQPTVSHHMKILSDAGLVHGERRSKWVYYSLDREQLGALRGAIDA
jgi:ArsR family transcriptional regulator, arsenate/arsenite/antimonite-responsive transcriptional repressor